MTAAPRVARTMLDAGQGVALELVAVDGAVDGPTVAVFGAVHGDELEGVAASRAVARSVATALVAGRVLLVPVANPLAFATRTRTTPSDGGNLARSFPGTPEGSDTERIADVLTRRVIAECDLLIDLHSAGVAYSMPLFVGCAGGDDEVSQRAVAAATVFGAPLGWEHAVMNPGRSLSAALDLGLPGIYVEGSGGGALARAELTTYVDGVLDVLAHYGILGPRPTRPPTSRWVVGGDGDVDASVATSTDGWCVTAVNAGDAVAEGDLIAEIIDADATVVERVVAPRPSTVMMLRRHAQVAAGDGIVMFGPVVTVRPEPPAGAANG